MLASVTVEDRFVDWYVNGVLTGYLGHKFGISTRSTLHFATAGLSARQHCILRLLLIVILIIAVVLAPRILLTSVVLLFLGLVTPVIFTHRNYFYPFFKFDICLES